MARPVHQDTWGFLRTRRRTYWENCSVEAMGLEPTNLLTASQALYQLSYAPGCDRPRYQDSVGPRATTRGAVLLGGAPVARR